MKKVIFSIIVAIFSFVSKAEDYTMVFPTPQDSKTTTILVDGLHGVTLLALNDQPVLFWPNGFNSCYAEVTHLLKNDGGENVLKIFVEDVPAKVQHLSKEEILSRIHVLTFNKVHVPLWGVHCSFFGFDQDKVSAHLSVKVSGTTNRKVIVYADVYDESGRQVASELAFSSPSNNGEDVVVGMNFDIKSPVLWDFDNQHRYLARLRVVENGVTVDTLSTRFGVRQAELLADGYLLLNGKSYKTKLADIDCDATSGKLAKLKRQGVNVVRTNNIPNQTVVDFCDEIGLFVIPTVFDEWTQPVGVSGYHKWFLSKAEQSIYGNFVPWAERDLRNVVRHYRGNASLLAWSLGPESEVKANQDIMGRLVQICEEEDASRKCLPFE